MSTDTVATESDGTEPMPKPRKRTVRRAHGLAGWAFLLPALLVYVIFLVYPMIRSLLGSLWDWRGMRAQSFTGLDNFTRLFSGQNADLVTNAFWHNVLWFIGVLVVQNMIGLLLAYILFVRGARWTFFQNWFFFPAILSPVLVGALWRLILTPDGPLDGVLMGMGITSEPLTLLGNGSTALWVLIAVDIWNWIGLPILVFLAGLNALNPEIFEAARLDGASSGRTLFQIAVPLVTPSVTTLAVLSFINSFNQFDIVYVMQGVQGGPNFATDTLVTFFYRLAFGAQGSVGITDVGLAMALGAILFIFMTAVSGMALRFFNKRAEMIQ
ncbi:sugar ABC transporter permease [Microbacterium pseudoresistens]|uniref:Raffinose/stachyose/melibiose transport system permease protein n=1 Tax=Microbacterium pseudoresistens TaxID=640634 RepID=A0A7Y9EVP3_9MICO|nr:sugar ABC transporter permease [Microbacterium pseudoresistens]NYD54807.1 raffinose/stachyose/melibiose transport system permease protein [Microbacterium pseudoresistens]